jgi:hypothetical protein
MRKLSISGWIVRGVSALSYVGMVAVNGLANALPLNGITTGEVSDAYFNLFAPAGVTFAIWGVIYVLLAILVVQTFLVTAPEMQLRKVSGLSVSLRGPTPCGSYSGISKPFQSPWF